jgi:hypothetical protein
MIAWVLFCAKTVPQRTATTAKKDTEAVSILRRRVDVSMETRLAEELGAQLERLVNSLDINMLQRLSHFHLTRQMRHFR